MGFVVTVEDKAGDEHQEEVSKKQNRYTSQDVAPTILKVGEDE